MTLKPGRGICDAYHNGCVNYLCGIGKWKRYYGSKLFELYSAIEFRGGTDSSAIVGKESLDLASDLHGLEDGILCEVLAENHVSGLYLTTLT